MAVPDINFTTTKIEILKTGEVIGHATGFFFRDNEVKYLATNRHVVIDEEDSHFPDYLRVTLHLDRDDLTRNTPVCIALYSNSNPVWLQHPNYEQNQSDVVLIPLNTQTLPNRNWILFNSSTIVFIESELINKWEVNSFGDVVIVGYPLGFHDEIHNLPVYRKAKIASCYGVHFKGLPYFLVDANLHRGTSGSPVVNSHHTLFKQGDGKEGYKLFGVQSAEFSVGEKPLGLNVVWYADLLVEIARQ